MADEAANENDDSPLRLSKVSVTKKTRKRCWSCSIEVSPHDVDCPECGVSLKTTKRKTPPITEKRKRKKKKAREAARDNWRESLFGAFVYAFPAVLHDQGWLCCLWCAVVMTLVPTITAVFALPLICFPFFGQILYLCLVCITIVAAPAGILSRNMEVASRWGVRDTVKHWGMSLKDEMIPSSIELLKANAILGVLPLLVTVTFAAVFRGFITSTLGAVVATDQIGWMLTGLTYLFVLLACTFCGPMCIMLLGSGDAANAIYPPNVFKVLTCTFPQYLAFYFYIVMLAVMTYILATVLGFIVFFVFGSVATVWDSGGVFTIAMMTLAVLASMFVVSVVATYFAAVVGWSMGIFIHRNYDHFDEIIERG